MKLIRGNRFKQSSIFSYGKVILFPSETFRFIMSNACVRPEGLNTSLVRFWSLKISVIKLVVLEVYTPYTLGI